MRLAVATLSTVSTAARRSASSERPFAVRVSGRDAVSGAAARLCSFFRCVVGPFTGATLITSDFWLGASGGACPFYSAFSAPLAGALSLVLVWRGCLSPGG
ncbi:hypothetical protein PF010_g5494 [Phytophthora fragariae]|uniref:Uncharacterized protein n=1 Tax=Phytophthora fragariae TaxID=53985 RepID=A0A6G0LNS4_9STRA|nr:hypothetical protein PF010_g5494 [Phytophthora fragariae]